MLDMFYPGLTIEPGSGHINFTDDAFFISAPAVRLPCYRNMGRYPYLAETNDIDLELKLFLIIKRAMV